MIPVASGAPWRAGVFRNYRLRVAAVVRDYGMDEREEAPQIMPPRPHKTG